jgi:hypothetical protein
VLRRRRMIDSGRSSPVQSLVLARSATAPPIRGAEFAHNSRRVSCCQHT